MRHEPIDPSLFVQNRERLKSKLLPKSLVVVNANDVPSTNADGSLPLVPNTDLFYLTGVEQEQSILVLAPDAFDESRREVLFLREPTDDVKTWEGEKLTKEKAAEISGIKKVLWLSEFPKIFRGHMCDLEHVYLNSNEHKSAGLDVESRDTRFVRQTQSRYPLHCYHRLAPLMHGLRVAKTPAEIELLKRAVAITDDGFRRVLKFTRPGVTEFEIEAEFSHEFTRQRGKFAYTPIIASGKNACGLHYIENSKTCQDGELLLLDVAASYANYNADLTRTIPVNGRFTPRQRAVYDAVLRVTRFGIATAVVGKLHRDWQDDAKKMMNEELLALGLLKREEIEKHTLDEPACKKYFMHGLGHPLGLDVHDLGNLSQPFAAGWVLTVEPGIYLPEEGFGVRLENDIVVTEQGPVDLMGHIPIEAEEIEAAMNSHSAA